jgi:hypothetical protein
MGQDGPEPHHEAAELVRGIQAIADGGGDGLQLPGGAQSMARLEQFQRCSALLLGERLGIRHAD